MVARHYRSGRSPGAAFAGLLAELFAEEGLLILDPRTKAMSRLAAPILRRAIEDHEAIASALAERARRMVAIADPAFREELAAAAHAIAKRGY